jgi:hypothetical protein
MRAAPRLRRAPASACGAMGLTERQQLATALREASNHMVNRIPVQNQ